MGTIGTRFGLDASGSVRVDGWSHGGPARRGRRWRIIAGSSEWVEVGKVVNHEANEAEQVFEPQMIIIGRRHSTHAETFVYQQRFSKISAESSLHICKWKYVPIMNRLLPRWLWGA